MSLPKKQEITFEAYQKIRQETDQRLEYVDGVVFMSPSPSTQHQRISMKLSAMLYHLLADRDCEVIAAPYDIELTGEKDEKKIIIPDLSVICDKSGFNTNKYVGTPELIIEILSPSNQSHDLIFKTNLYQACGVKEYWIINPMLSNMMIYAIGPDSQYRLVENEKEGIVKSTILQGFAVDVKKIIC